MKSQGTKRKRDHDLLSIADTSTYRRSLFALDSERDDLVFQLLECEDASKDKHESYNSLIRLHGTTESGHSVIVLVREFNQYMYCPVSTSFEPQDLEVLQEAIQFNTKSEVSVKSMEIVTRQPLEFYRHDKRSTPNSSRSV